MIFIEFPGCEEVYFGCEHFGNETANDRYKDLFDNLHGSDVEVESNPSY